MRNLLHWFVPGGALLIVGGGLGMGLGPEWLVAGMVSGYPWVVFGTSVLLAVFFHRSRVAVAVLAVAVTAWISSSQAGGETALHSAGGFLALAMAVVSVLKDRGLFSAGGLIQVGGAVVVGSFGALFVAVAPQDIASFLAVMPLPVWMSEWSGFPQPVFLAYLLAFPITLGAALVRKGPVERGVFWAVVFSFLAIWLSPDDVKVVLFLMMAGLSLGLSVVETSYAMAYRDDLTLLPARRALMRDLEGLGGLYTAAMVDVDHFKKFNDRYGHDVGDQVLRLVASRLAKTPGGGKAYRYGGEEFTILYPGKSREDVLTSLEEVRQAVADATFTLRHWRRPRKKPVDAGSWKFAEARKPKLLSVKVSIGVADSTGIESGPEEVLKKADRALYRAKKGGRNRVSK